MKLLNHCIGKKLKECLCFTALLTGLAMQNVSAQGVAAGTVISNTAIVSYDISNQPNSTDTIEASNSFTVAETINAVLTSLDTSSVVVPTPATDKTLTWQLTNTGNGSESFLLNSIDTLNSDDFNPTVKSIWLETNGVPGLQSSDMLYQTGNAITLASDQSQIIYIQSDIPPALVKQQQGNVKLIATSTTPGATGSAVGDSLPGAGEGGTDAVVLIDHGQTQGISGYSISNVALLLNKTVASVVDPFSGTDIMSESIITYQIDVTVTGDPNGTIGNLVIEDTTPANMQYVAGSTKLDNQPLTDNADTDNADFNITKNNTVSINLGDITPPANHTITITYKVK